MHLERLGFLASLRILRVLRVTAFKTGYAKDAEYPRRTLRNAVGERQRHSATKRHKIHKKNRRFLKMKQTEGDGGALQVHLNL